MAGAKAIVNDWSETAALGPLKVTWAPRPVDKLKSPKGPSRVLRAPMNLLKVPDRLLLLQNSSKISVRQWALRLPN